jgi:DHA2 family multidrug resistance protein
MEEQVRPQISPWLVSMSVMLATFMEVLDTSVANVALPHIAGSLSVDLDSSTWVLTSYLVSNAIVLPLTGWLASLFGRKNVLLFCVGLFTLSSLLCGLAPNLRALILFRVFQGIGGGALQPMSQAILFEAFPPARRGIAMGIFGMGVVVAPIVGPTLGGWISDNVSWRWIFFMNVPVGLLAIFLNTLVVFDPPYLVRKSWREARIDYIGLGLVALGLGALQIFLDKGQVDDWLASRFIVVTGLIAAVSLTTFIVWEWRHPSPVVDLHLLKDRNLSVAVAAMFVLGVGLYGSIVLLPIFLQSLMGYTATLSGLVLSPGGLLTLVAMPIAGALVSRISARYLVMVGLAIVSYSMFYMAGFNLQIDFGTAMMGRLIQGAGLAFMFVPINAAAFLFIPKEKTNHATGLVNLVRNIGGSCGIAFITTFLARRAQFHQSILVAHLTPFDPAYRYGLDSLRVAMVDQGTSASQAANHGLGALYGMLQRQATMMAYVDCFWALGILTAATIPAMFLLRRGTLGGTRAAAH